jgi:hypothetical protein
MSGRGQALTSYGRRSWSVLCHLRTWRDGVRGGPNLSENTHFNFANRNSFCASGASAEVNYRRGVMVRVSDHKDLKCRRCYQEETRAPAGHRSP